MPHRPAVPKEIEAEVLVRCRRRCCVCYGLHRDSALKSGQIAHLDGSPKHNDIGNLAFLCLEHHDEYDSSTSQSKGLTTAEVRRFRDELEQHIEQVWNAPAVFEGIAVMPGRADFQGRYIRENDRLGSEIQVTNAKDGRVHVQGLALWATKQTIGPHIGTLDFEAPLEAGRVAYSQTTPQGELYTLELIFQGNGRMTTKENRVHGLFGMNVSFEGEWQRR